MALIYHIGGATSIGANWIGGVIPGESDIAIFDNTSSGGSIDYLQCMGIDVRPTFTGILTQDADIILGAAGFRFRGGTFKGGNYDFISEGEFIQEGGVFDAPKNKFQVKSYPDNLYDVQGNDLHTMAGLDLFSIHAGVEFYVGGGTFFRSTGDFTLMDSRSVASTSDWGTITWGEILFKIRSKINEPEAAFFSDEELMVYFNASQLHFARETKFLEREQAFTIKDRPSSPPYQYVMMPSGFLGLKSVALQSKTEATDITFLQRVGLAGRSNQSFKDQAYYLVDHGELRITQEVDVNAINLLVRYYAAPNVLVDPADTEVFTQVYDEYLEDVLQNVFMQIHLKRKEYEEYQICERMYGLGIVNAQKNEGRRHGGNNQIQAMR